MLPDPWNQGSKEPKVSEDRDKKLGVVLADFERVDYLSFLII